MVVLPVLNKIFGVNRNVNGTSGSELTEPEVEEKFSVVLKKFRISKPCAEDGPNSDLCKYAGDVCHRRFLQSLNIV
jgi:hypothetical protein